MYTSKSRSPVSNPRQLCTLCIGAIAAAFISPVQAKEPETGSGTSATKHYSVGEVIKESLVGDVYAHSENWEELGFRDLFTKGWDKPWTSPPNGAGYAPRHGWLNAYDGVFYRLSLGIFGWQHQLNGGDSYTGSLYSYTSLSERFELQSIIPSPIFSEFSPFHESPVYQAITGFFVFWRVLPFFRKHYILCC